MALFWQFTTPVAVRASNRVEAERLALSAAARMQLQDFTPEKQDEPPHGVQVYTPTED